MLEDSYSNKDTIYMKMYNYSGTYLIITNIFCQSLGPSLYRGSTVLNFIYLFFKKWGSPFPRTGPALAWLRLYNTPKIEYARSGNNKKTLKLQPLHSITVLGLFNVITGMTKR